MDFLKNAKDKLSTGSSSNATTGGAASAPAQNQDYGDKGIAAAEKHFGMNVNPSTNEKITDGARGLYEKQTGKPVNPKFSN